MIAKLEYLLFISSNYGVHFRLIAAEFAFGGSIRVPE